MSVSSRTAPQLWDAAFRLARPHYPVFLAINAVALILTTPVALATARVAPPPPAVSTLTLVSFLVQSALGALVSAALTLAIADAYHGRAPDIRQAFRGSLRRAGAVVVSGVLTSVLVLGGLVLLILPGLFLTVKVFAVEPVLLLEARGVGAAFRRSWQLARGFGWRILGTVGLSTVVFLAGSSALTTAFRAWGTGELIGSLLASAVMLAVSPVLFTLTVLVYYEIRSAREGYDLELARQALPAEQPAT